MGGFFSNPPAPPPPIMPPAANPEDAAEAGARLARERRRRAQGETIATSYRGLLPGGSLQAPPSGAAQAGRKKLIGE